MNPCHVCVQSRFFDYQLRTTWMSSERTTNSNRPLSPSLERSCTFFVLLVGELFICEHPSYSGQLKLKIVDGKLLAIVSRLMPVDDVSAKID